jgi:hypothetical protein
MLCYSSGVFEEKREVKYIDWQLCVYLLVKRFIKVGRYVCVKVKTCSVLHVASEFLAMYFYFTLCSCIFYVNFSSVSNRPKCSIVHVIIIDMQKIYTPVQPLRLIESCYL